MQRPEAIRGSAINSAWQAAADSRSNKELQTGIIVKQHAILSRLGGNSALENENDSYRFKHSKNGSQKNEKVKKMNADGWKVLAADLHANTQLPPNLFRMLSNLRKDSIITT